MKLRRSWRRSLLVGCLVRLAACGPGGGSAPSAPAGGAAPGAGQPAAGAAPSSAEALAVYRGADRQQVLEAGARQEGKVTWYTTTQKETLGQPVIDAFTRKYPFLQVDYYRADSTALVQRLREETRAGRRVADVFETTTGALQLVVADRLLLPVSSPLVEALPADTRHPEGYWSATWELYPAIGYNTNAVTPDEAPKSYDDLLDPRWRGKIGLPSSSVAVNFVGLLAETKDEDFVAQLGRQDVRVREVSQTALANLVASGEVPLSPVITSKDVRFLQGKGAPIAYQPVQPIGPQRAAAGLVKVAPHPHAALLLLDFLLSPADGEGRAVIAGQGYGTPGQGEGTGFTLVDLATRPDYPALYERWEKLLNQYLARAAP
jgi:iron(III) transport system substrate-binding protein